MVIRMKNLRPIKKITATVISISVFSAFLPVRPAQAASTSLFVEDFESYEVGTIIEADSNQTSSTRIGNIEYQLQAGDKLEIAQENGNKYLKITRPSSSATNSHIKYYFPETYSGKKYTISYDFRPEVHSRHFARFGSFIREDNNINLTTVTYKNNFYANPSTNNNYYVANLLNSANYTGSKYATVTQTVDLTSASGNYTFHAEYPNSSGGTATATKTNTANQLGIKGLAWAIKRHATNDYNGLDDATSAAVYRIDNIVVTTECLSVSGANIATDQEISVTDNVKITFDEALPTDYANYVSVSKNGQVLSDGSYTLSISEDKKELTVSGFDYNGAYTVKVDKDLKSADGKPMAEEYKLSFKTNSLVSHNITKERYEKGFIPVVSERSGITYEYAMSKDGGAFATYDFSALDEVGSYSFKITATDGNGKQQIEIIEFDIVGKVAPEAKNVSVSTLDALVIGTELTGEYTYFDSNDTADENMDYCTYQWYRSSSKNGVYAAITGATGTKYTLTAEDEDKFIKFGVKPYSKVEPKEGEESLSGAFASFMNPTAENVAINGKASVGEELTVSYDYVDLNGDAETTDETEVIWYISDAFDGEYTVVGSGKNYTAKNEDANKYLKACVIPKNDGAGKQDKSFYSYSAKISAKEYFAEDFEGYEVGVIATGPANTISMTRNAGGLSYRLAEGDTLEIVEKDGSKVLKLTANNENTTERQVFLDFDKHYGNNKIYDVGFDYFVENNSVWFNDFGTLYDDDISGHPNYVHSVTYNPIKIVSSYRDNLYFNGNTNADNYIGGGLLASANAYWRHQNEKIDFSKEPKPIRLTTTNASDGSQLASKESTFTYTYGGKGDNILADNISSISWRFKRNGTAGWNGQDAGSGVYYIDNVTLNTTGISAVGSAVSTDGSVIISFDSDIAADAGENIGVFKSGEQVAADKYSVSVSGRNVTVSGLDYNADYEIKVYDSIADKNGIQSLGEYTVNFKTASLMSYDGVEERHSTGYVPDVVTFDGISYNYFLSKNGGAFSAYDKAPIADTGKYELKVVATDANGKTQTEVIDFEIVGEIPPEVKNINVTSSGTLGVGSVLSGTYTYFDVNDDIGALNEDYCDYQWYRSDSKDGVFTPISGTNGSSYTLTAEDEDKFIKFGVKPYSKVAPKEGEEYLSDAFVSFMNPTASEVTISGKMVTDEQLTISYKYADLNGDAEITEGAESTTVIWYTATSQNGAYSEVGRGRNYTIKDADSDKWLKVAVIPKNNGAGSQNKKFYSESVQGAFAPAVSGVRLIGNANVGSTVSVDYKFYDANGDLEDNSTVEWYVGGVLVSNAAYYTIGSNDKGKSVYAVVTPKTDIKPCVGLPVQSDSKTVSDSINTVKPSGGEGGGSGGGVPTPSGNENQGNPEGKKGFKDISGHWAEQAIEKMVEKGIIFGKSADQFAPDDNITRAEFAAIISRMFKLTDNGYSFNDVAEDSWYRESVAAVASAGYMQGADGCFRPDDNITREEMAVVIAAITAANGIEAGGEIASFTDFEKISDWAKNSVSIIAEIGIIKGMDDNSFMPKGEATRAQTVMMLTRLWEVLAARDSE